MGRSAKARKRVRRDDKADPAVKASQADGMIVDDEVAVKTTSTTSKKVATLQKKKGVDGVKKASALSKTRAALSKTLNKNKGNIGKTAKMAIDN